MKDISRRIVIALGCASGLCAGGLSDAQPASPLTIGVNRPHLAWVSDPNATLDQISANFSAVRLTAAGQIDKVAQTVIHAKHDGLHVLLVIPMASEAVHDTDTAPRPGKGKLRATYRLSELDLALVHDEVTRLVSDLDQAHTAIDTVEVGNEINWAGFNGDLSVSDSGKLYDDVSQMGEGQQSVVEGLRRYAMAVKTVKDILRKSSYQQHTLVIGAGLMTGTDEFVQRSGGDALSPKAVYAVLRKQGALADLDGFAIHIYPKTNAGDGNPEATIVDDVSRALDACAPDGRDCYITEWGFVLPPNACPQEDPRNSEYRIFLHAVQAQQARHPVKAAYVYDWDTSAIRSIYRCGRMLPDRNAFR